MIGLFGKKVFEITTRKALIFNNLSYGESLKYENVDTSKGKPTTYVKGAELIKLSLDIACDVAIGLDPKAEFDDWRNIMNQAKAYKFILDGESIIENKLLLTSVNIADTKYDNKGKMLHCKLSLSFLEYIEEPIVSTTNTNTPGVSSITAKDYYNINTTSPQRKADKRQGMPAGRLVD